MAETGWLKIPELAATELVSEGPAKINSALTVIDKVDTGEQDYLQPGVVSASDWLFAATVNSATGELGSEGAAGGVAWLPGPSEASRLMRSVTAPAKLEALKASPLLAAGFYMTVGFELTASSWGSSATVSVKSGTEYATQVEAEAHSPSTSEGKIRVRDVVVENASGVYSIVKQTDRRIRANGKADPADVTSPAEGAIAIAAAAPARICKAVLVGNGTKTAWEVVHSLGTERVGAQVWSGGESKPVKLESAIGDEVTLVFPSAPTAGALYQIILFG